MLCWRATFAPGTCLLSACPRSCQHSSLHWARPVAPRGCPLEIRPPLGLTTYFPPYVLSPRSTISPALPTCIGILVVYIKVQKDHPLQTIPVPAEARLLKHAKPSYESSESSSSSQSRSPWAAQRPAKECISIHIHWSSYVLPTSVNNT